MGEPLLTGFTANWLWYLEGTARDVALDASNTPGTLALQLSSHFSKVHILRDDTAALDAAMNHLPPTGEHTQSVGSDPYAPTIGSIFAAPWEDHTFDCVAVHDAFASYDPKAPQALQMLRRIRSLLKPEGWFVGGSPNPYYVRRSRRAPVGISSRVFSRLLLAAHFREVRCLLLTPSIDRPGSLIPDARSAAEAYEGFDSIGGLTNWKRRVVVGLGLRGMLYPGYLMLAQA